MTLFIFFLATLPYFSTDETPLAGAWELSEKSTDKIRTVRLVQDDYFMETQYDMEKPEFIQSFGGKFLCKDGKCEETIQFHTKDREAVGKKNTYSYRLKKDELSIEYNGKTISYKRIDSGNESSLAGNWRITHRKNAQGEMGPEIQLAPRRTLKLLTGTRFQWSAINVETGEFFGTGGGSYTFKDGKYTETIEFFSRDNSRVGAALSFNGEVKEGAWHHSGLSSKGEPIYEIWGRFKE